jgi:hypothetical protein
MPQGGRQPHHQRGTRLLYEAVGCMRVFGAVNKGCVTVAAAMAMLLAYLK